MILIIAVPIVLLAIWTYWKMIDNHYKQLREDEWRAWHPGGEERMKLKIEIEKLLQEFLVQALEAKDEWDASQYTDKIAALFQQFLEKYKLGEAFTNYPDTEEGNQAKHENSLYNLAIQEQFDAYLKELKGGENE